VSTAAIQVIERPILFSGAMVRAILEGRKTQTRRVAKGLATCTDYRVREKDGEIEEFYEHGEWGILPRKMVCPYGKPGDRLWVRETFRCANETCDHEYCGGCDLGSRLRLGKDYADVQHVATPECCDLPVCSGDEKIDHDHSSHVHGHGSWWLSPPDDYGGVEDYHGRGTWMFLPTRFSTTHPSIHMPRWASRLTLEITQVRVERLQDINKADCIAEGMTGLEEVHAGWHQSFARTLGLYQSKT
jgi:hypothetical protein